ncbi:MAG: hypothetical protein GOMPHAMPRED_004358 [Gomphillus americanus]|uniref:Sister chromatid cohesion acetyltransferase Eco1 n=1 Tax=Gomphillus americanus TaxID=1940652 RepID=A0A8H3IGL6_9LECA|nr:MAG: hypothetical protein GOMPHAMPRED_004358 [Gomphillus americanus]
MVYGISNSQKRGIIKTYSRKTVSRNDRAEIRVIYRMGLQGNLETETIGQLEELPNLSSVKEQCDLPPLRKAKLDDDTIEVQSYHTPNTKRILEDIPSSPLSPASNPFSDDEDGSISVPSSPPSHRNSSVECHATNKPTFGFINRKRKAEQMGGPLSELNNNVQQKRNVPQSKKQKLVQMKLDLGGKTNKTCKECGMEYIPSNSEDAALHKSFHMQNIGGVDLGRGFVESVTNTFDAGTPIIITLDGTSPPHVRRKARKVLDVVRTDLGAIDIEDDYLWGIKEAKDKKSKLRKTTREQSPEISNNDKPKLFLYCVNDRCIGLCLVERIATASKVVSPTANPSPSKTITQEITLRSSSIFTSPSSAPMLLGISRIWVSRSRRGHGIATKLLDYARTKYFYGIEIPKSMIAFSQPTASGIGLAEKWFQCGEMKKGQKREMGGWHVYAEGA